MAEAYDHILMARVSSIPAKEMNLDVHAVGLPPLVALLPRCRRVIQRDALKALRERKSRIIVCVNMLGEGFDLPR